MVGARGQGAWSVCAPRPARPPPPDVGWDGAGRTYGRPPPTPAQVGGHGSVMAGTTRRGFGVSSSQARRRPQVHENEMLALLVSPEALKSCRRRTARTTHTLHGASKCGIQICVAIEPHHLKSKLCKKFFEKHPNCAIELLLYCLKFSKTYSCCC